MRRTFLLSAVGILAVWAFALTTPVDADAQGFGFRSTRVQLGGGLPDHPGGFTFCRLAYRQVRREAGGGGWETDFPDADRNLATRLPQLTTTTVSRWNHGEPGFAIVSALEPELFRCPFLFGSDVGTAAFNDAEVLALREYFLKGGFLWVDDFWGNYAWQNWTREILRILPEFEIVELPMDHPLFHIVYRIPHIPQIPSIRFWRTNGGATSERGIESAVPRIHAIMDDTGKILVVMSHNTDIADGWEREAEDPEFFYSFSPDAYAVGVNIAVWMMTH